MLRWNSDLTDKPVPRPGACDEAQGIAAVTAEVIRRRNAGEALSDEAVIEAHPELMPELADALRDLSPLCDTYHLLHRAGQAVQPLDILSDDALEAPIELSSDGVQSDHGDEPEPPEIVGYRILDRIDIGGQATVYKARQFSTGKTVAIKVLLGGAYATLKQRNRFDREADILAAIEHPNIVGILDRGRAADGSRYIIVDYVDGRPIDAFVAELRRAGQPANVIFRLFAKVARAVDEANQRGVVHRDLKPSNVLVDRRGEPRVMDFGLAHWEVGSLSIDANVVAKTVTGQIVGSLPWASPEQVSADGEISCRTDVYALGVMLYEAITGVAPYPVNGSITDVLKNIAHTIPAPPSQIVRLPHSPSRLPGSVPASLAISRGVDAVLLKCLRKAPTDRYVSAQALAEELERLSEGVLPLAGRDFNVRASARRKLALASLFLACTLGATAWPLFVQRSNPTPELPSPPVTAPNAFGMGFVCLQPVTFAMGSGSTVGGRQRDESWHLVRLTHAFEIGTTEVTRGQYRSVIGHLPDGCRDAGGDDEPVTSVTWDEAHAFCVALGKLDGRRYRLPTEAEWEYACRGGSDAVFSSPDWKAVTWYSGNSSQTLHPVESKPANHFGLYGMQGNAAEWCEDSYSVTYPMRIEGSISDPVSVGQLSRVVRGGSFESSADECRAAARSKALPTICSPAIGFRLARDPL